MIEIRGSCSIAAADGGEDWNGDRLRSEISRRAAVLRENSIERGDRILLHRGSEPAFFADLLAAWRLGACVACTNPGLSREELANVVEFISASVIVARKGTVDGIHGAREVYPDEHSPAGGLPVDPGGASLDDPALILFTSGTTGTPKGVVHSFRSLLARVALNRAYIGDDALAETLCVLPTHFGHGLIGNCLTPLLSGQRLVLAPGTDIGRAAALGGLIDRYGITFMSSVPAFWRVVLKVAAPPKAGTLRRVHVGSAPLSAELWKRIIEWAGTKDVVNMYGITETANWLAGSSALEFTPEDGLVGRMWGGAIGVLGDNGQVRSEGEGELLVQSPSLMQGYYMLPDLTETVLRNGWFHTGDVGRVDASGVARLTGRRKHEINRAGIKIHPEDIDLLLERHPGVLESCAFGIPDEISGEIVGVAVRLDAACSDTVESLRGWCRERVRREAVPERWFLVNEIPRTDRGKINREAVMRRCLEGAA
ncbi:MAG: acyl--CoA ligase [Gammaproteobacteria bacterium]|nr:acyl--CoA ligase [Gammaproteobacteria bacterium]